MYKIGVIDSYAEDGSFVNGDYNKYAKFRPIVLGTAISNVADVISGMPYPDHFAKNSYGIAKPWNSPYELMYAWASDAMKRQKECPTPAVVRTWVQAYDVMKYVDSNGIAYNGENVKKEIEGLYKAGADGGYITWNSGSSLAKYKQQKSAFDIDYKELYSTNEE